MSTRKNNLGWDNEGFMVRLNAIAKPNPSAFARAAKLTDQSFRKYLSGSIPGSDVLAQIAKTAGVSIEWLVWGENERVQKSPQPSHIQKECDKVAKILTSDYQHLKDELVYYLNKLIVDCEMADRNAAKFKRLEKQNKEMQRELKELRKREPQSFSDVQDGHSRYGGKGEG